MVLASSSSAGALFLGTLQGVTEFLPVSSSGHLVLFQQFFDAAGSDAILFDLILHLGTLIPVLYFYREDVWLVLRDPILGQGPWLERPGVRLLGMLVAASIPTAIIGLAFEDLFEQLFATPSMLTLTFAITGCLLFASGRFDKSERKVPLTIGLALALGLAQGLAITPGISRSGTTISIALMLGIERTQAARFSFLMSVPAILGAVLLKLRKADPSQLELLPMGLGFLAALISGYLALVLLVRVVQQGTFPRFAWYCWAMALVAGGIAFAG